MFSSSDIIKERETTAEMAEGSVERMQSKSTPRKQQKLERHCFGMFQKVYPLPDGAVIHGDRPDVIISGDRKIGIEVTNFYHVDGGRPDSEQVQRTRRAKAISRGQRLYEEATGINFQLTLSFDKRHPIQDAEASAKRLVEVTHRVEGSKNGVIRRDVYGDIPELNFVYLYDRELVYPSDYFDPEFPNGAPDASEGFRLTRYTIIIERRKRCARAFTDR